MPLDADGAADLERRLGDLTEHEFAHRAEHSIELQVVFLQAVNGQHTPTLLPVLCSSWDRWVAPGQSPRAVDAVERVVQAVRDLVTARAGDLAIVASVDFSHVGPRFGDLEPVSPALATKTSVHDREILEAIVAGDAELFWQRATAGGNPTRIDAISAVYLAMRALEPVRGRLLKYGQAEDPAGGIVSFASLALR
jgi:AmmeMemoRadiSam system protein B